MARQQPPVEPGEPVTQPGRTLRTLAKDLLEFYENQAVALEEIESSFALVGQEVSGVNGNFGLSKGFATRVHELVSEIRKEAQQQNKELTKTGGRVPMPHEPITQQVNVGLAAAAAESRSPSEE